MISVAGKAAAAASDADDTVHAGPCTCSASHLAAGSLPFYLTSFATIRQRVRAAGRRRLRRPVEPQEAAHGGLRLGRARSSRPALPDDGRQLAARRRRHRHQQHPRRLLAGQLLRDPGRHLRPRTSATGSPRAAGRSATSAAGCCSLLNLVLVLGHDSVRAVEGDVGPALACSAPAVWWAGFTIIPVRPAPQPAAAGDAVARVAAASSQRSFGQLLHDAEGDARLPDDADLPGRLPLLQRRHPDGHLRGVDVRLQAAALRATPC